MTHTLRIKPSTDVLRELYENHEHFHPGDSGIDLYCPEGIVIPGKAVGQLIDLGIQCEMGYYTGYYDAWCDDALIWNNVSFLIIPRSSISKTSLRQSNSVGLIDAGYRGNMAFVVDNITNHQVAIKPLQRLCQVVAPNLSPFNIKVVDSLSETSRGDGAFGSTGE